MSFFSLKTFIQVSTLVSIVSGGSVYITDLPAYSSLAPCASSAVSYVVQALTEGDCPAGVTALESCACTKDSNSAVVSSSIASNVLYNCGATATDDITSASLVFDGYCNQGAAATTAAPSPTLVTDYITDLSAYSNLAPCATSAVSEVVQGLTNYDCPPGASALASCACTKNQNSLAASESINSQIYEYCGSTHTEDVTSAQAVFAGYCNLGNGITSFPVATPLAGDVTYYITDMPIFASLGPCAASAVSEVVMGATNYDCGASPAALVSCICVKDQNSLDISQSIVSEVTEECGTTASADVSSAIVVLDSYCSAGNGLITPSGITVSGKIFSVYNCVLYARSVPFPGPQSIDLK